MIKNVQGTMATTIEKQVALDEALVPSTKRDMLHICPRVLEQLFDELPFEEEILDFLRVFWGKNDVCLSTHQTPLNIGIKELKTHSDVQDFVRVGYENKSYADLYDEHFDYDVMDFIKEEANGVVSSGSSDEYYSSDEIEEFDEVDFHTEGEENVVIKNLTTHDPFLNKLYGNNGLYRDYLDDSVHETEGEALDDPDGAHIDPIHKAQKGVTYPKHDLTIPRNKTKPILEVLMVVGVPRSFSNKKTKKNLFHDEDAESSKSDKSAKCTKSAAKCTKSAAKSTKSGKAGKYGKSVKSGIKKKVSFSQPI
nr:splicing factor [Tanacetum cinerariifolium]